MEGKDKKIHKRNIVFIDMPLEKDWDFVKGLEEESNESWLVKSYVSNQGRTSLTNILRYIKYFYYSFLIFLTRNKYDKIICWQAFYGIIFAFYCRIFHVKKRNIVIIKNLIYKPKNSFIGKIYFRWFRYIITSDYIDLYISASETNSNYCVNTLGIDSKKIKFIPFSVHDATSFPIHDETLEKTDYILSLGRSNRDWEWLIKSFKDTTYHLIIICDELTYPDLPSNITILNNVWDYDTYKYIKYCKCMVIPILIGSVASGDTVLVRGMSFSKPVIINRPSCLADDYVKDGINGLIVNKTKEELLSAVNRIYGNKELYDSLAKNARETYLTTHTLLQYGKNMANEIKRIC
ncbi:MAG: glycosyltransferase [Candidatus Azobacteroides sp.]|nr:glycosyltransferase [Candidatus Azobacteroides sp.]